MNGNFCLPSGIMNKKRLIARLDLKGDNVIKGVQLDGLRVVGKARDIAANYYQQNVDELLVLDSVASLYGTSDLSIILETVTQNVFVPVTAGGGVKNLTDALRLFGAGADRISINTGAFEDTAILPKLATRFGAQSVVLSVECKQVSQSQWNCFIENGREDTGVAVSDWIAAQTPEHIGEILLTSIDRDGTKMGPDIGLLTQAAQVTKVPIIYSGGIAGPDHFESVFKFAPVNSIAVGAALHSGIISPTEIKGTGTGGKSLFPRGRN